MQINDFETALDRNGDGAVVLKYNGKDRCLLVPTRIDGKPVTAIAAGAFEGSLIESIELPETLKRLEAGAFTRCDELVEINVPGTLSEVGNCLAFECQNLRCVVINGTSISASLLVAVSNLNGVGIAQSYVSGSVRAYIELQLRSISA